MHPSFSLNKSNFTDGATIMEALKQTKAGTNE